jgi:hypothetical protein
MRFRTTLCAVATFVLAASAAAKDTPQSVLDDAKALAKRGDALKTAERFGDAIALAQAAGDLAAEEAAADETAKFVDDAYRESLRNQAKGGGTNDAPTQSALLAAILRKLDPVRCGAFVSAPVLARGVLQLATETGDFASVADAAKVAASHGSRATSGRAAAVVAKYADGMRAVADGKYDVAALLLDAACADAGKSGWIDLAAHAGTEAAASWFRAGAADKAAASATSVAALFDGKSHLSVVIRWSKFAHARLAGAPPAVVKPVDDAVARYGGAGAPGAPGGRGGKGASAGATPISDVGKLLPRLAKGKPFVSVARVAKGMEVRWTTTAEKPVKEFADGVEIVDEGGVTVALCDRSVALMMIDLEGTRGQPGGRGEPQAVRAFYLLAEGETWNVSKEGVVTITR